MFCFMVMNMDFTFCCNMILNGVCNKFINTNAPFFCSQSDFSMKLWTKTNIQRPFKRFFRILPNLFASFNVFIYGRFKC